MHLVGKWQPTKLNDRQWSGSMMASYWKCCISSGFRTSLSCSIFFFFRSCRRHVCQLLASLVVAVRLDKWAGMVMLKTHAWTSWHPLPFYRIVHQGYMFQMLWTTPSSDSLVSVWINSLVWQNMIDRFLGIIHSDTMKLLCWPFINLSVVALLLYPQVVYL